VAAEVGQFWTPIILKSGSLLHADSQSFMSVTWFCSSSLISSICPLIIQSNLSVFKNGRNLRNQTAAKISVIDRRLPLQKIKQDWQ
jgi:hypothetical protein